MRYRHWQRSPHCSQKDFICERETVIMRRCISALAKVGHIRQITDGRWLFKALLAAKLPCCNSAVFNEFGHGEWWWMFDAPMGNHQLAVALASHEKLAFQGVDAIKWTYIVMPFGPTNGPATFINFIHDVDSIWKELAKSHGITIGDNTNTRIIVDDIVNWADKFQHSLLYM